MTSLGLARKLKGIVMDRRGAAQETGRIPRAIAYGWLSTVMRVTAPLPDFRAVMRLRGFLARPCFRRCGANLQLGRGVEIAYPTSVDLGNDVFIARGAWILAYGGLTLADQAMLGPYTVITTSNHSKTDGSWRFGTPTAQPVVLERGVWTGAHAVITPGVTVGQGTAVGAGAVVTRDLPPHIVAGGIPARELGKK
jgi:acetyltransferase-like isoleucine patch superfamily enzyme